MRQTSRGKQLRPTFDSLDYRIAPSSMVASPAAPAPADTSTTTGDNGTTTTGDTGTTTTGGGSPMIGPYQPINPGGSPPRP